MAEQGQSALAFLGACMFSFALLTGCKGTDFTPDSSFRADITPGGSAEQATQQASGPASEAAVAPALDPSPSPHRRTCCKAIRNVFTKPWYGNYLGPENYGYDKRPIDALDAAAREHDLAYDRFNATGIAGALFTIDAGKADLQLAKRAFLALPALDFQGKLMGVATGVSMGFLGIVKEPFAEMRRALRPSAPLPEMRPTS
jgi:hypothetical protein